MGEKMMSIDEINRLLIDTEIAELMANPDLEAAREEVKSLLTNIKVMKKGVTADYLLEQIYAIKEKYKYRAR